jgi:hypothetical protein
MSATLVITLAGVWGRNFTMTSSNEEIHWSLLYFTADLGVIAAY